MRKSKEGYRQVTVRLCERLGVEGTEFGGVEGLTSVGIRFRRRQTQQIEIRLGDHFVTEGEKITQPYAVARPAEMVGC